MKIDFNNATDPFQILEENKSTLFAGSEPLMKECIEKFLNTYYNSLNQIEEQISRSEWKRVKESTHKIKGVLKLFAREEMISLCKDLENAALNGDPESVQENFQSLQKEVISLGVILREFSLQRLHQS